MRLFPRRSDVGSEGRSRTRSDRVVWQAASVCLSYPGEAITDQVALVRAALMEAAPSVLPRFADLLAVWESTPVGVLQARYVQVFDLSGKQALYLSYWTDGDTRRRGEVLTAFKARYRRSGFLVDTHGELPDYLPLVLEYGAIADPADAADLLQQYRASLELLRLALVDRHSEHAGVVAAVCDTLPGASPATRQEVHARAQAGPPVESVGLDPYDPRLLPLSGKG